MYAHLCLCTQFQLRLIPPAILSPAQQTFSLVVKLKNGLHSVPRHSPHKLMIPRRCIASFRSSDKQMNNNTFTPTHLIIVFFWSFWLSDGCSFLLFNPFYYLMTAIVWIVDLKRLPPMHLLLSALFFFVHVKTSDQAFPFKIHISHHCAKGNHFECIFLVSTLGHVQSEPIMVQMVRGWLGTAGSQWCSESKSRMVWLSFPMHMIWQVLVLIFQSQVVK